MTESILLLRHAHTIWNGPPKRFQGRTDIGLSGAGIAQCFAARHRFNWVNRIVASPALRVRQTIDVLFADRMTSVELIYDENLWEIDNGWWGGKTLQEVSERDPEGLKTWLSKPTETRPGEGETLDEMLGRAKKALAHIRSLPPKETLVATHGGIIRVVKLAAAERSLDEFHEMTIGNLHEHRVSYTALQQLCS